ncbi:uncharacterized protein LOC117790323 isoform X3 [Drosophila innubila]|uniref:uncharacterized protein LOC117790323 isoform X3 n=1 Tax=Drosophila innubila TaxID=198719 RepID=UPI00148D2D52|nr:uncharacterized protein LOC117790323 isoform X3 [Drosophila innubila]
MNEKRNRAIQKQVETLQMKKDYLTASHHTTIRGGSLKEQKHMRRLNNITGKNERLDIQIGRGSPEVKERSRNDQINHNNKRSFNTLSQHIWKRIRIQQKSLESQIEGWRHGTTELNRNQAKKKSLKFKSKN